MHAYGNISVKIPANVIATNVLANMPVNLSMPASQCICEPVGQCSQCSA